MQAHATRKKNLYQLIAQSFASFRKTSSRSINCNAKPKERTSPETHRHCQKPKKRRKRKKIMTVWSSVFFFSFSIRLRMLREHAHKQQFSAVMRRMLLQLFFIIHRIMLPVRVLSDCFYVVSHNVTRCM